MNNPNLQHIKKMINKKFLLDSSLELVNWEYVDNLIIANSDNTVKKNILQYRKLCNLAQSFNIDLVFPLEVSLETSFKCNLKCKTCIMSLPKKEIEEWGETKTEMSFELAKRCIDEMGNHITSLVIQGTNEPLLTSWFFALLDYTTNKIKQVLFSTNGILLNGKAIDKIINSHLALINISLDANTKATYKLVRNADVYQKVSSNIKMLLERRHRKNSKLPVISVSFVHNCLNTHEQLDFIRNWSKFSDIVCVHSYMEPFKIDSARSLCIQKSKTPVLATNFKCSQPWYRIIIRNNGDVLPCCSWYGMKIVMGNVNKQSIEEVWNSNKFKKFRYLHKKKSFLNLEKACRECMLKSAEVCDPTFLALKKS